jgi:hypothetical protein
LDEEAVHQLLGVPPKTAVESLLVSLQKGAESREIVRQLTDLYDQGYQATAIAKQLGGLIRQQIIEGAPDADALMNLLTKLLEVPVAHEPERFLEIILLATASKQVQPPLQEAIEEPSLEEVAPLQETVEEPEPHVEETNEPAEVSSELTAETVLDEATWPQVLQALKTRYNTLYGIVRMAQPHFIDKNTLELAFAFAFHQKRLNEKANRAIITDTIRQITGRTVKVECIHDAKAKATPPAVSKPRPAAKEEIATISNIFGGAELLES